MKFGTIVLQVNTHRLTESDFWFDVTLSRCRPWRHFRQKSAAAWWVSAQRLCSFVWQFLICSTICVIIK